MSIMKNSLHQIMYLLVLLLKNQTRFGEEREVVKFYRDSILDQIIPICHRIESIVTPVVHNLSPEGYIPEEFLENLSEKSTDALAGISQHLLVCCWRAHKEVSGMFAWISDVVSATSELLVLNTILARTERNSYQGRNRGDRRLLLESAN